MAGIPMPLQLSDAQFKKISTLMHDVCGINLRAGKEDLVRSRLLKRLQELGLDSFEGYMQRLKRDTSGEELAQLIDVLTTNKTSFFREHQHFDFLRDHVLPELVADGRKARIWSAGCSSGEEPFSIAILLAEKLPAAYGREPRILASDISTRMLAVARAATYDEAALKDMPARLRQKYFTCAHDKQPRSYRVNDDIRAMVRPARLNLMDPWPMSGPFDLIFCRNVMIYFDKPTQEKLVSRLWKVVRPGGHLFVGHSESLTTSRHDFRYVQPAVYVR